MPALQRSISIRGPKFFHDGAVLMFVYYYDASTRDGPRPATNLDMLTYPDALRLADLQPDDLTPDTEVNNPTPEEAADAAGKPSPLPAKAKPK